MHCLAGDGETIRARVVWKLLITDGRAPCYDCLLEVATTADEATAEVVVLSTVDW